MAFMAMHLVCIVYYFWSDTLLITEYDVLFDNQLPNSHSVANKSLLMLIYKLLSNTDLYSRQTQF